MEGTGRSARAPPRGARLTAEEKPDQDSDGEPVPGHWGLVEVTMHAVQYPMHDRGEEDASGHDEHQARV